MSRGRVGTGGGGVVMAGSGDGRREGGAQQVSRAAKKRSILTAETLTTRIHVYIINIYPNDYIVHIQTHYTKHLQGVEVGGGADCGRPLGLRVALIGPLVWGMVGPVDVMVACPLSSEPTE